MEFCYELSKQLYIILANRCPIIYSTKYLSISSCHALSEIFICQTARFYTMTCQYASAGAINVTGFASYFSHILHDNE